MIFFIISTSQGLLLGHEAFVFKSVVNYCVILLIINNLCKIFNKKDN